MSNKIPYGFIYKTVLPDGRFYLGQHKIISHKTLDPYYFGSGVIIKDYIKSKGKNTLTRKILAYGYSWTEMNILEAKFITDEILSDPLCINLDRGGRHKYTRTEDVNQKISNSMISVRAQRKDTWTSLKGKDNKRTVQWKLISPQGQEFVIWGLDEFCNRMGLSPHTIKTAVKEGWIPRRGKCAGWQVFNLSNGLGTTRDVLNYGSSRSGVNNPSHKAKIKRQTTQEIGNE